MAVKLGDLLVEAGHITPDQLAQALRWQETSGGRPGAVLVGLGLVKDADVAAAVAAKYRLKQVDLGRLAPLDDRTIRIIPPETARKYLVLPISRSGKVLTVAVADPTNVVAMDDIKFMTGCRVEPVVASESALKDAIDRCYGSAPSATQPRPKEAGAEETLGVEDLAAVGGLSEIDIDAMFGADEDVEGKDVDLISLAKSADAGPVVKLTNVLLVDSLKRRASDIHIEPYEKEFRVRFRIDGVLCNVMALPTKLKEPLTSRIKVMAKLDIAEKRLPQDGQIKIKMKVGERSRDIDFRVSTAPTRWGEKIAMRVLDKSSLVLHLTDLGLEPSSLERFRNALTRRSGMVLVTGPTGSGKTNTLYSAAAALNGPGTNIMTAEDRIDHSLPGINQVQVRSHIGLNTSAVLRTLLRQDPDVILVDEIRDQEAAETAIKTAARPGCFVLAGMNDTDTASVVEALTRASGQPFLVGRGLSLVVAQRLVRRICSDCRVDVTGDVPSRTLIEMGIPPDAADSHPVFRGKGCSSCNGTGYKGRVGLFEVAGVSESIRALIKTTAEAERIRRQAMEEGMLTLRMSGLLKIKEGVTTVEEVLRHTDL